MGILADYCLLFQHTAARRRLGGRLSRFYRDYRVSTHSRPKAAGDDDPSDKDKRKVSTHSRPKAAGYPPVVGVQYSMQVSTHSRPKAAGQNRV